MRAFSLALFVWVATVVPASAQIYTWRDGAGNLVLSNKPRGGEASLATYAVPGAPMIRTSTKPAVSRGATAYDDLISQNAARHGISADLVRAVIQAESGFNRYAVSPKGAMGLMQLMPATARDLGVTDPFHPAENIRAGVAYLAGLLTRFKQNVEYALAAYNAGAARVERYDGVPPYRETQAYVKKITRAANTPASLAAPQTPVIYKWIELVDGQPKTRFSNVPPSDQSYEVVGKR
jgi:soluble lytic murein transglycosylase-like protein